MDWEELYTIAKGGLNPRTISPFIHAAGVAAAILTANDTVYTGVCVDMSCSLGMCAERKAIVNMRTNSENKVVKLVSVMSDGSVGSPCGACREYLIQLDEDSSSIQILTNLNTRKAVLLKN